MLVYDITLLALRAVFCFDVKTDVFLFSTISWNWDDTSNINILRLRQNRCHFPDDIFKHIFLNENVRISIQIPMKFVP